MEVVEELTQVAEWLKQVSAVRMPQVIRKGKPSEMPGHESEMVPLTAPQKIGQLESYLLLTAEARGLAESARLASNDYLLAIREEWAELQGWEMYLVGSKKSATTVAVDAAKAQANPKLAAKLRHADYLVKRLTEQINRLEHDDGVASRVYTLITSG